MDLEDLLEARLAAANESFRDDYFMPRSRANRMGYTGKRPKRFLLLMLKEARRIGTEQRTDWRLKEKIVRVQISEAELEGVGQ